MAFPTNVKKFGHFTANDKMKNLYGDGSFIDQRLKFANFCA